MRNRSTVSITLLLTLLVSLMSQAIAAQPVPPDDDPEISDNITAQVEITVIVPVFDPHLCYDGQADGPLMFDEVTVDAQTVTGSDAQLSVCVEDTMADRGPYSLFLVADDFTRVGANDPVDGSAFDLRITRMSAPVSSVLNDTTGRIVSWNGGHDLEPAVGTEPMPGLGYLGTTDLATAKKVGEVRQGSGTGFTTFRMTLSYAPYAITESGVYTTKIYLDVYFLDTP